MKTYATVSRTSRDDSRESRNTDDSLLEHDDDQRTDKRSSWRLGVLLAACAVVAVAAAIVALGLARAATQHGAPPSTVPAASPPDANAQPDAPPPSPSGLPDIEAYWRAKHPLAEANKPLRPALRADPHFAAGHALFKACFAAAAAARAAAPFVLYMIGDSTFRVQYAALCSTLDGRSTRTFNTSAQAAVRVEVAACVGRLGARGLHLLYVPATRFDATLLTKLGASTATRAAASWFSSSSSSLQPSLPPADAVYLGAGLWQMWPSPFVRTAYRWVGWPQHASYAADLNRTLAAALRLNDHVGGGASSASGAHPPPHVLLSSTHSVCAANASAREQPPGGISQREIFACGLWLMRTFGLSFERAQDDCAAGVRRRAASVALNEKLREVLHTFNRSQRRQHSSAGGTATLASSTEAPPHRARRVSLVDAFALTDGRCWANLDGDLVNFARTIHLELKLLFSTLGWAHVAWHDGPGGPAACADGGRSGDGGGAPLGRSAAGASACNCSAAAWRALGRPESQFEAGIARAIRRGRREEERGQRREAAVQSTVVRGD